MVFVELMIVYIMVFWVMTQYSLVGRCERFGRTCTSVFWRCRQDVPPKLWQSRTALHDIVVQETTVWILTAVKTSDPTVHSYSSVQEFPFLYRTRKFFSPWMQFIPALNACFSNISVNIKPSPFYVYDCQVVFSLDGLQPEFIMCFVFLSFMKYLSHPSCFNHSNNITWNLSPPSHYYCEDPPL